MSYQPQFPANVRSPAKGPYLPRQNFAPRRARNIARQRKSRCTTPSLSLKTGAPVAKSRCKRTTGPHCLNGSMPQAQIRSKGRFHCYPSSKQVCFAERNRAAKAAAISRGMFSRQDDECHAGSTKQTPLIRMQANRLVAVPMPLIGRDTKVT